MVERSIIRARGECCMLAPFACPRVLAHSTGPTCTCLRLGPIDQGPYEDDDQTAVTGDL